MASLLGNGQGNPTPKAAEQASLLVGSGASLALNSSQRPARLQSLQQLRAEHGLGQFAAVRDPLPRLANAAINLSQVCKFYKSSFGRSAENAAFPRYRSEAGRDCISRAEEKAQNGEVKVLDGKMIREGVGYDRHMLQFHASLHARPASAAARPAIQLGGQRITPLLVDPRTISSGWNMTFDQASEALAGLPRMFLEPDGSFVWVGASGETRWQVDGNLFDGGSVLAYVDLKGTCSEESFEQFLRAFGWPECALAFHLPQYGVFLSEEDFRRITTV